MGLGGVVVVFVLVIRGRCLFICVVCIVVFGLCLGVVIVFCFIRIIEGILCDVRDLGIVVV